MKKLIVFIFSLVYKNSYDKEVEDIELCTDVNAINYNSEATIDDGTCEYDEQYVINLFW